MSRCPGALCYVLEIKIWVHDDFENNLNAYTNQVGACHCEKDMGLGGVFCWLL